jgi:acetyl esterase/lipase
MFNCYAGLAGPQHAGNPRLHPVIADVEELPDDMLLIVGSMDILCHEHLVFEKRVRMDLERLENAGKRRGRLFEVKVFEGMVHGWLERKFDSRPYPLATVPDLSVPGKSNLLFPNGTIGASRI